MSGATSSERGNRQPQHFVTLHLDDIHDLFAVPRSDPFLGDYLPASGIDQLVQQLRVIRPRHLVHTTIVLPAGTDPSANLHAEVEAAFKRYSDLRLSSLHMEVQARGSRVLRSLRIGILILGISLALAAAVTRVEGMVDWLRTLLSNSLSIFGSVALWSPTDSFLFGMRPLYDDVRICKAIRDMSFEIQYTGAPIPAPTVNP